MKRSALPHQRLLSLSRHVLRRSIQHLMILNMRLQMIGTSKTLAPFLICLILQECHLLSARMRRPCPQVGYPSIHSMLLILLLTTITCELSTSLCQVRRKERDVMNPVSLLPRHGLLYQRLCILCMGCQTTHP